MSISSLRARKRATRSSALHSSGRSFFTLAESRSRRISRSAVFRALRSFHAPADAIMVATASLKQELELHGFKNVALWSRGVDVDLFAPGEKTGYEKLGLALERPVFLYVGRVAVEKDLPIRGLPRAQIVPRARGRDHGRHGVAETRTRASRFQKRGALVARRGCRSLRSGRENGLREARPCTRAAGLSLRWPSRGREGSPDPRSSARSDRSTRPRTRSWSPRRR